LPSIEKGAEPFKPPLRLPPIDSLPRSENQDERNRQTIGANAGYAARVAFSLRLRAGAATKLDNPNEGIPAILNTT
jgi:hypothetical protein